jgi:hypothetical protein
LAGSLINPKFIAHLKGGLVIMTKDFLIYPINLCGCYSAELDVQKALNWPVHSRYGELKLPGYTIDSFFVKLRHPKTLGAPTSSM